MFDPLKNLPKFAAPLATVALRFQLLRQLQSPECCKVVKLGNSVSYWVITWRNQIAVPTVRAGRLTFGAHAGRKTAGRQSYGPHARMHAGNAGCFWAGSATECPPQFAISTAELLVWPLWIFQKFYGKAQLLSLVGTPIAFSLPGRISTHAAQLRKYRSITRCVRVLNETYRPLKEQRNR